MALRLHDLNYHRYWALIYFIPVMNVVFWFALLILPGTEGESQFGIPSTQGNPATAILLTAYISS